MVSGDANGLGVFNHLNYICDFASRLRNYWEAFLLHLIRGEKIVPIRHFGVNSEGKR